MKIPKFDFESFNPREPYNPYFKKNKQNPKQNIQILTVEEIKARIEEAVDTDRRDKAIPKPLIRCYWPDVVHNYHEAYAADDAILKLGPPDKSKYAPAEEVLCGWLRWTTRLQAKVILDRSRIYYNGPKAGMNLEWEKVRNKNKINSLTATKRIYNEGIEEIRKRLFRQAKDGEHIRGRLRAIQCVGLAISSNARFN